MSVLISTAILIGWFFGGGLNSSNVRFWRHTDRAAAYDSGRLLTLNSLLCESGSA